jgi:hypothetical protein
MGVSMERWITGLIDSLMGVKMFGEFEGLMQTWMDGLIFSFNIRHFNGWADKCKLNGWMYRWMEGCSVGWIDDRMDGWMNRWLDG